VGDVAINEAKGRVDGHGRIGKARSQAVVIQWPGDEREVAVRAAEGAHVYELVSTLFLRVLLVLFLRCQPTSISGISCVPPCIVEAHLTAPHDENSAEAGRTSWNRSA
jgi:hypothetical protein